MKLLIIHKTQFGYHNNAFKLCRVLKDRIDITYICFDGHRKIEEPDVTVKYVPVGLPKHLRGALFMILSLFYALIWRGGILVYYFPGCEWYKRLFRRKKMLLDIRTLSVYEDEERNRREDERIKKTADRYNFVTFLSEGMRDKIGFSRDKSAIVPLGADIISTSAKVYIPIKLLYVGTFMNRKLGRTLEGLKRFVDNNPTAQIEYHIVGDAGMNHREVETRLQDYVGQSGLGSIVFFHGRIPNKDLKPLFDLCNVGVSFVPITPYFDFQPVTKTFEYAMSGLYVIATKTFENRQVIDERNGILIDDTPESFANALQYIYENNERFDEQVVRNSLSDYLWSTIENKRMYPVLDALFNE